MRSASGRSQHAGSRSAHGRSLEDGSSSGTGRSLEGGVSAEKVNIYREMEKYIGAATGTIFLLA